MMRKQEHSVAKALPFRQIGLLLFGAAASMLATTARGTDTLESAAIGALPGATAGEDAIARAARTPDLEWSRDLLDPQWRERFSLRIPKTMLAQASAPDDPPSRSPEPTSLTDSASLPEFGSGKSYLIPAMEILGFDLLLNRYNARTSGSSDYDVTMASIRKNLRSSWVTDNDPFSVNQFAHPYQGSMYHGFARSAGLNFWESAGYTFAGSLAWEYFGETTPPAKNDQVASGIAGSFLGEALFRMSSLVLEQGSGVPMVWREVAAAVISPSTGFNRLAFGDRFNPIFSSRGAAYYSALQLGWSGTTQDVKGTSSGAKDNALLADFSMQYGLPGLPGYEYTRPFDYFSFHATASSANIFENVQTRGLLVGKSFAEHPDIRGIWGLYGSYDYISPQTYRISSTALSFGSTAQWWMSKDIALQGTALVGVGYAGVGTLHGTSDHDYNYGVAPQALLATRLIFGNRASLDLTAREYFVNGIGSANAGGHDNISRADMTFTVRVYKKHAVAFKYLWNRRAASYSPLSDQTQANATVSVFYSYIGSESFGAVDWR
jgi:hypothetical protein